MLYRRVPKTGEELSILGYGGMRFPTKDGKIDEPKATGQLRYAAERDLAVIVMEPLKGGNLAHPVPPSVQAVWDRAEPQRSTAEWGLRWLWNQPEVTVAISGMNDDKRIRRNLRIAGELQPGTLTDGELQLIREAAEEYRRLTPAACTGCRYCMPCPAGVDIPT